MQKYKSNLQDAQGRALVGAQITVLTESGEVATLFKNNGITPLPNPVTTNQQGEFEFYVANGRYSLRIRASGYTGETDQDVVLAFDPDDYTADNVEPYVDAGDAAVRAYADSQDDAVKIYADGVAESQAAAASGALVERLADTDAPENGAGMVAYGGGTVLGTLDEMTARDWFSLSTDTEATVRIPSDFPSLQAAIDSLTTAVVRQGRRFNLLIEDGHGLTRGLYLREGDYSHFGISHEGSGPVALDASFVGVSNSDPVFGSPGWLRSDDNLIIGYNARMPVLRCQIDMGHVGGTGVFLQGGSMIFESGSGVINAAICGIYAQNSQVFGIGSVWNGAGAEGIRVQQCATASFQEGFANDCCSLPISADSSGFAVYAGRGTTLQFQEGTANNSGINGIGGHRSFISATDATINGSANFGAYLSQGVYAILNGATITGSASNGVQVADNSIVNVVNSTITDSGSGNDIFMTNTGGGGLVFAAGCTTTHSPSSGIPSEDDVGGIPASPKFNLPYASRGMILTTVTTGGGVLWDLLRGMGAFSTVGATNGKRFTSPNTGILDSSRDSTSPQTHYQFYNQNGLVGNIQTSGSGTIFNATSDETLKNFLGDYDPLRAIQVIHDDPVREYEWKATGERGVGWGAQTSHAVSPELGSPGGWFDAEGNEVPEGTPDAIYRPWGIDYSRRTPYLWAAVSWLVDERDVILARLEALEAWKAAQEGQS